MDLRCRQQQRGGGSFYFILISKFYLSQKPIPLKNSLRFVPNHILSPLAVSGNEPPRPLNAEDERLEGGGK